MVQIESTVNMAKPLASGDAITVNGMPTTKENKGITFVEVPTTEGLRSSSGSQIVGFLTSPKVQATIQEYLIKGGLDMFVTTTEANTGNEMLNISYFDKRKVKKSRK